MNYWLIKSEPSVYSIDDLRTKPRQTDHWDGVRNYQARNFMRSMSKGDLAIFYHSNCPEPGAAGIVEVVSGAYPDFTSWDRGSGHFDPGSTPESPRWYMVDVKWKETFERAVALAEMRRTPGLEKMLLLRKGQRLSVMPVNKREFYLIATLSRRPPG